MNRHAAIAIAPLLVASGCGFGQGAIGLSSANPTFERTITAKDLQFSPSTLRLPDGEVVAIVLENLDPGILHNVALIDDTGEVVFRSETFAGIDARTFRVAPLEAGPLQLVCDVHPTMTGQLSVGD